jgi:hypothetical protein
VGNGVVTATPSTSVVFEGKGRKVGVSKTVLGLVGLAAMLGRVGQERSTELCTGFCKYILAIKP